MTRLMNNPDNFPVESAEGFLLANKRHVRGLYGGAVRATKTPDGKVALVIGGGTGHYPAFAGWVGHGMADGVVMGNIFSSPSAAQAVSVAKAAERGGGVLIAFGNYAGDVLHFGDAAAQLSAQGIPARAVVTTDDIASADPDETEKRRGIAGWVPIFKATGAAAERGMDLDEVERVFHKANSRTRTLGVAFSGCTLPGDSEPLFTVPEGKMAIGLGVHGEPGIAEVPFGTADEVARVLVEKLLEERPEGSDHRVIALLNGLGTAKYEEMFVTYRAVYKLLEAAGLEIVDGEVGEFATSLDMSGISLTLCWVDDELIDLWNDPVDTPTIRRGTVDAGALRDDIESLSHEPTRITVTEKGSEESRALASNIAASLDTIAAMLRDKAAELGKLDSYAGDGDHGVGMQRGSENAADAARKLVADGAGAGTTLAGAGEAWSATAGGTSGALWGVILNAAGHSMGDSSVPSRQDVVEIVQNVADTLQQVGAAAEGDKTMLDALLPFVRALSSESETSTLAAAWRSASTVAAHAAEKTAELSPKIGRARPLAEKSVGHADPGAVSLAYILAAIGEDLS
ncbi:dihydroxyacetone kinase family protein [Flaviflexus equikiangi]|uniref:Dihydroxyacetone kinase family protein n=1 Tax=Flaviflexus equikiangi TaxID=2758573 RepID=A0ABS2TFZ9_9ACTO|nr:dihydroxyacetone kinase family protein [Flaviflexus equikiangi]MBM9433584.1 dihydroxyacetone kinase family protein [Flaviflexus equikiangi]